MTPEAPVPKILCEKFAECGKVYKSRTRMLTHMKAIHKDTPNKRTALDSPLRLALFQIREDGDEGSDATQGDSNGEINSPKVISEGRFVCSACDQSYPNKEDTLKHIADSHGPLLASEAVEDDEDDMTGDEEVLEEACELYEALVAMTTELNDSDSNESTKDIINKLDRFKVLVEKKTQIQKETTEEVTKLREVEEDLQKDIKRKEKEIALLKNASTKEKEKIKKDVGALQSRNGEVLKENANLEAKLREKEAFIRSLEDQSNSHNDVGEEVPDDGEDVAVIEEVVSMRNNASGHKCTLCDKRFSTNEDLERHIRDKHTEAECPFCSAIFPNNNKPKYHVNNCMQNGTAKVKCDKCKQVFTSFGIK